MAFQMKVEDLYNKNYDYDEDKGSYYMDNPLKLLELKTWPDIWLAVCSPPLLFSFAAMFVETTKTFAIPTTILISGIFFFGIGGKLSYYRYRDSNIEGNMNAWFPGWRHSLMANTFAVIGIILTCIGVYKLYAI